MKKKSSKKISNDKISNNNIIDNYDYLSNAASTTDFTGLIPSLPESEAELESYNDIYRFRPLSSEIHSGENKDKTKQ